MAEGNAAGREGGRWREMLAADHFKKHLQKMMIKLTI